MASLPPLVELTPANRAGAVVVLSYTLIISTILFCAVRLAAVFFLRRGLGADDVLIVAATIIGLAQSILIEHAAISGIGRHSLALSSEETVRSMRFWYASNILWAISQGLAKGSLVHTLQRLSTTASALRKRYIPIAHATTVLWTVFTVFALSFQCRSPRYLFRAEDCLDGTLWYPVIILNFLTDLGISLMFAPTVWHLQMRLSARMSVASLFLTRLIVCIFSIAQLTTLAPQLTQSDLTRNLVIPVILAQFVMCFSILTAAGPPLHRVFKELQSGGFAGNIPFTEHELSQLSASNGQLGSKGKAKNPSNVHHSGQKVVDFRSDILGRGEAVVSSSSKAQQREESSRSSREGSEDMIIRRTQTWQVSNL